jgi:hypothetical protein
MKLRHRALGLALISAIEFFLVPHAKANLILNGSFESPGISGTSGFGPGREQYTALSGGLTDWTVSGPGDIFLHQAPEIGAGDSFNFAQDGTFYLDLSGSNLNSAHATVSQAFATIPLAAYELSFYIGASNQTSPAAIINVQLTGAGTLLDTTLTPLAPVVNINWSLQTFSFVADSTTTQLSFHDESARDENASFVDNVSVNATVVPEPATFTIFCIGAIGVLAFRWRRRKFPA